MKMLLIHGHCIYHSVYRSEMGDIYGTVLMTEIMNNIGSIGDGGINMGFDRESTLFQCDDIDNITTSSNQQNFDLLSGINRYVK